MRIFWLASSVALAIVGLVLVLAAVAALLNTAAAVLLGGIVALWGAFVASTHVEPLPAKSGEPT